MNICISKSAGGDEETCHTVNRTESMLYLSLQCIVCTFHGTFNSNWRWENLAVFLFIDMQWMMIFKLSFPHSPVLPSLCLCDTLLLLAVFIQALHIDPALSPPAPLAISLQEYGWGLVGRGMHSWSLCSAWWFWWWWAWGRGWGGLWSYIY